MKNILIKIQFVLLLFMAINAKGQVISTLSLSPQGTQPYNAGTSNVVNLNCSYSGLTPGTTVEAKVNFDNTILNVSNCNSSYNYTTASSGNITTITYLLSVPSNGNDAPIIPMCFSFKCPQFCAGTPISTTLSATAKSLSNPSIQAVANPTAIQGLVNNDWTGTNVFSSYNASDNTVTFNITINRGTCLRITNTKFIITPNIGYVASVSGGTLSGNTLTPGYIFIENSGGGIYTFSYTIKLPCNTPPSQLTTNVVLYGDNCAGNSIIKTLPQGSLGSIAIPTLSTANPNYTITKSFQIDASGNNYLLIDFKNSGNTYLNTNLQIDIPDVKTIKIMHSNNSSHNTTTSLSWFDCNNISSSSVPFQFNTTNNTPPSFAKKAIININGLLPNEHSFFMLYFDFTNSCNGISNASTFPFNISGNFICSNLPTSCMPCGSGSGTIVATPIVFNTAPLIRCKQISALLPAVPILTECAIPNDTLDLFIQFSNDGTAALQNGTLKALLPPCLTYLPGFDSYSGFSGTPNYIPSSNIEWQLPNNLPTGSAVYKINYKAIVNNLAQVGGQAIQYSYSGSNITEYVNLGCWQSFVICEASSANVTKLVKGNNDLNFVNSGNGQAGSNAFYEITVNNTGTTFLKNVKLIDRLPFNGDLRFSDCAPRNSQFTLQPNTSISSITGVGSITYSSIPNVQIDWFNNSCNTTNNLSSFTNSFVPNNVEFTLTNSIAPGNSFTFQFPVKINSSATMGQIACNSIALKSDVANTNGNILGTIGAVESNNACLTVSPLPTPPCNCTNDDKFISKPKVIISQGHGNNISDSIACGGTIATQLKCGQQYNFAILYNLQGLVQGQCNGTDSVVIKDASGLILNIATNNITSSVGISSVMVPANTFTQNGTYSVTFYLKKNGIVCSQCTMYFNVQCADVPCTSCKKTLIQAKLTTTQTNGSTSAGNISFTTGVTVQQVTMSIANIKYKWNIPGCQGDCKTPINERACILPTGNNQTVGTLQWSDFTSTNVNNVAINKCLEELKWNNDNSAALVAGTYNIPFSINLPKPLIEGCCKLEVEKLCIRLRFKNINCNVCDTVICLTDGQISKDCCFGGNWLNKSLDWTTSVPQTNTQLKISNSASANVNSASKTQGSIKVECGTTIQTSIGTVYTLSADYSCNTGIQGCNKTVTRKVKTPSGISFGTWNYAKSFTFTEVGMHTVTYYAYCDAAQQKPCDSCVFYVNVEKKCCQNGTWIPSIKYNTDDAAGNITQLTPLPSGVPTIYTKWGVSLADINFQCASGCTAGYTIKRKNLSTNVEAIEILPLNQHTTSIYAEKDIILVTIVPTCDNQSCVNTITFKVACSDNNCGKKGTHNPISFVEDKQMISLDKLNALLLPIAKNKGKLKSAKINYDGTNYNLLADYKTNQISIPLILANDGTLILGTSYNELKDGKPYTNNPLPAYYKSCYPCHVTLLK